MPLIWTSIHSTAAWKAPPAPPRLARAAIAGIGWLVASEVMGGWSVTFVPDADASDPKDQAASGTYQSTRIPWASPSKPRAAAPKQVVAAPVAKGKAKSKSKK